VTLLALLVAIDALLHFLFVYRFGVRDRTNAPYLVFAFAYLILAVALALAWPYALWATLLLTAVGLAGLTMTFNRIPGAKGFDRVIWGLDAAIILLAAWLLFAG
jgi:hypothetical protein